MAEYKVSEGSDGGGGITSLLATQHLLEEIESLGVVADEDDLVVRFRMYAVKKPETARSGYLSTHCRDTTDLSSTRNFPPHSQWTV